MSIRLKISLLPISFFFFTTTLLSCDKQPIGPSGPDPIVPSPASELMKIADFRALYPGTGTVLVPAGTKKIRGVVISNNANEAAGNYRIQDENGGGIYLYTVVGSPIYPLGSVIEIDAAGAGQLLLYNGDLELKNVPMDKIVTVPVSLTISPRVTTCAEIVTNRNTWASTLVRINNLTGITQASTNTTGTTYTITDATGSLTVFVRAAAGITVNTAGRSITGYVSIYKTATQDATQIGIRSAADIQ
ncbi:MAG: hypothetical protein RL555_549 [Bacteroidota bacterium]|jgi:hypothetical protein|nr:hypothetical protein [Bacteroidota bacterium]GDX42645.1 hypothetical protein LBMAG22_11740 [Bacteroidota bacterium]